MKRRTFLAATFGTASAIPFSVQDYSDYSRDPRPEVPEGTWTAGGIEGEVFQGSAVVSGPAADAISILQPLQRMTTGYLEYVIGDGPWLRVDGGHAGLLPLSEHALKFRLPPLPPGKMVIHGTATRDTLSLKMDSLEGIALANVTMHA